MSRVLARVVLGLAGAMASVAVTPIAAANKQQPIEDLTPSSPWTVDYAEESCRLLRTFGKEPRRVALGITSYEPRAGFALVLSGKPFHYPNLIRSASLRFGPSLANEELPAIVGTLNGRSSAYTAGNIGVGGERVSIVNGTDEAATTTLSVKLPDRPDLQLQVGKMDAPMTAMRACLDDLIRHWGLDPSVQAKLSRRVAPANDSKVWFSAKDYPTAALNRGLSGAIRYRLLVDNSGAITDCKVQGGTAYPEFAQLGCARLRERAQFNPALDARGHAVASYFTGSVFWDVDRKQRRVSWQI